MWTKADQSLQIKLIRITLLILLASLIIVGLTFHEFSRRLIKGSYIENLTILAEIFGNRSIAALVFNDESAAAKNLSAARYQSSITSICLYDQDQQLFALYKQNEKIEACPQKIEATNKEINEQGKIVIRSPIMDDGNPAGYITITSSLKTIIQAEYRALAVIAISLFLAALFAYLFISRMLNKQLRPLKSLNDTAVSVIDNFQTNERAQRQSNDEIGSLVDVFNKMLDDLAEEREALQNSERRFRTLAENAPIGIYLRDEHFNIIYANESWKKMTGFMSDCDLKSYIVHIDNNFKERYGVMIDNLALNSSAESLEYIYTSQKSRYAVNLLEYIAPLSDHGKHNRGFVGSLLDVTELKNAHKELEQLAFYDPLTNLPNRRFFNDHLNFMLAQKNNSEGRLVVLMLDLDNFKKINDTLGHDSGDKLLVKVGKILREIVFRQDVVSRMGGDEFMILLSHIDSVYRTDPIAQRIIQEISRSIEIDNHRLDVSVSIGVSSYPQDGTTAETLIKNADIALYHAKSSGRGVVSYFSSELAKRVEVKTKIETKLHQAIENDELEVYLQPQWDIKRNHFFWTEALLRWDDSQEGLIPPSTFIDIAEDCYLIGKITDLVIVKVCQMLSKNRQVFQRKGIKGISINLSAQQFFSEQLLKTLTSTLSNYSIDPSQIELEITESLLMQDIDSAIGIMHSLRDLGFKLSIDDFGTGYSSLSYLKKFPLNSLKIDRSFIKDIPEEKNDIEIAAAIIAIAKKLDLTVIAEGIETEAQYDILKDMGCDFAQGYLFSKPVPITELGNINNKYLS